MIKVQHLNICILLCSLLSCKSEEFNEGQTKLQMEEYLYIIEDVNESLLVNSPFYSFLIPCPNLRANKIGNFQFPINFFC